MSCILAMLSSAFVRLFLLSQKPLAVYRLSASCRLQAESVLLEDSDLKRAFKDALSTPGFCFQKLGVHFLES